MRARERGLLDASVTAQSGPLLAVESRAMKLGIKLVSLCILFWLPLSVAASETANLRNGYSIQFERRELRGEWTRLYLSASPDDFVDVRTEEIIGIELEGMAPIPARPPAPRANEIGPVDFEEVVSAASTRTNLSPDLIKSVIRVESGFNPNAISRKGAQGLMQLMPETAARMGVRNPLDPSENVDGGARYLRELLGLFSNDVVKALAAYNAGPKRVEQFHGVPPYPETVKYVNKVIRDFNQSVAPRPGAADDSRGQNPKNTGSARPTKARAAITPSYSERHPLSEESPGTSQTFSPSQSSK